MILCPHNIAEPEHCGLCDDEFKQWWSDDHGQRLSGKRLAERAWYAGRMRVVAGLCTLCDLPESEHGDNVRACTEFRSAQPVARMVSVTPEFEEAICHLLNDEADFFEVNRGNYAETERQRNVVRTAMGFKKEFTWDKDGEVVGS